MSISNPPQPSPPKSLFKKKASRKTKITSSKQIVWTTCHIPVPEQMVVMSSASRCALAHGREKSAATGAGCQCPCHSLRWWLGIEEVYFLALSATMCRHGRSCRLLQSCPHPSILLCLPIPGEKALPGSSLASLSSPRAQQWQELLHWRERAPVGSLVRQVLMPTSP